MCGIVGYLSKTEKSPSTETLNRSTAALSHRGPDSCGFWTGPSVGLGFRRLKVIDLATGDQPMTNEDETLRIVFNGEIYNHRMIRDHLEAKGHQFRSRSDTEVILHLYEEEGSRCVEQLRGMFAFAIYNQRENSLFLARDRFGKKPMVYAETPSGFYFSSEIGALKLLADVEKKVDAEALDAYLALRYVPGERTAWSGIRRLPAGSTMRVRKGVADKPDGYWRLSWSNAMMEDISPEEAFTGFRQRFEESVRLRLVADVSVGVFLSGGIDSSVTVAAIRNLGVRPKTFCIGFEDRKFDESAYAREIARRLDTDHHDWIVAPDSLEGLDAVMEQMGEPFGDQSLLPTMMLSKFARRQVTVALSGDGGDEFFAGYKRYRHLRHADFLTRWGLEKAWMTGSRWIFATERILNPSRRHLKWPRNAVDRILNLSPTERYLSLMGSWPRDVRVELWKKVLKRDFAKEHLAAAMADHPGLEGLSHWQALDAETYLVEDILRKVDAASMAVSLECRCPLLDHHVAEFAAGLPERFKWNRREGSKVLLRKLYPDLLPPHLLKRKKKGFSMPIGKWMRKQWREPIRESIEGEWGGSLKNSFQRLTLQRLWREHQSGQHDHGDRLWTWFVLWRWNQRFEPDWNGFA